MKSPITIVECPRDAMQGWPRIIPSEKKRAYIQALMKVGFDVLDFGSFVSPRHIPQMADTAAVLEGLDFREKNSRMLAIVANLRGASDAASFSEVDDIGFPFSVSETFQMKNTGKTIEQSLEEVKSIYEVCKSANKALVIYLSMGFGNPYGDEYHPDLVLDWMEKLKEIGIESFQLSDTVGVAEPKGIRELFEAAEMRFPGLSLGAHFHSLPHQRIEKLEAAYEAGCRRFDTALLGIGGCPMADNDLVGNMDTETLVHWADRKGIPLDLDRKALEEAKGWAAEIFI